jgi:hypothetical protein
MKDGQDSSIACAVLRHSAADDQLQLRRGSGYPWLRYVHPYDSQLTFQTNGIVYGSPAIRKTGVS